MALSEQAVLGLSPGFRFQWEPAQQTHVLLFPEGMVKLNASAAEIIRRCDGSRTLGAIIDELRRSFTGDTVEDDARKFVERAHERGWICEARGA